MSKGGLFMRRIICAVTALLMLTMSVFPSYSGTAEEEADIIEFDDETAIPLSCRPVSMADECYYVSEYMPDNIQGQGLYGTCWAFSSVALAEISMIKNSVSDSSVDLSEGQLIYNVYHTYEDPLGNMGDDKMHRWSGSWLSDGGSLMQTTMALAAWKGIGDESVVPYSSMDDDMTLTSEQQSASLGILTEARWFNMSQRDVVKNMIIQYGAVSASMYHNDRYFNEDAGAYYQNYTSKTNHAITVIGWDDDYSASNFNYSPEGDGAWICRNSWGDWWGLDGYCYISYYDKAISDSRAYSLEMTGKEVYDNNYQYDGGYYSGAMGLPSGYDFYNTFTATCDEELRAAGIFMYSTDVEYSLQVYNRKTGEAMLSEPVTGCTQETGYYTVELPEPVALSEGDEFAVCFTITSADKYVYVMIDTSNSGLYYNYIADNTNARSYYAPEYGNYESNAVSKKNSVLRIKALTTKVKAIPGDINGDGGVNLSDLYALKQQIAGSAEPDPASDVNGDGTVNLADIYALRKILLG